MAYWSEYAGELAQPFSRAIERGELAPDADPALLAELLISPMVVRTVIMKLELTDESIDHLAAQVLRAARAHQPPIHEE